MLPHLLTFTLRVHTNIIVLLWNGLELFALIMGWIGCIVGYSSVLHEIAGLSFYWDRTTGPFGGHYSSGTKCSSTGAAFCAFMVLAFLLFTVCIICMLVRILHTGYSMSALRLELITFTVGYLFYFIAVPIWSGCLHESEAVYGATATLNGYGYVIAADIFLFFGVIALFQIYRFDVNQMWNKSTGTSDAVSGPGVVV